MASIFPTVTFLVMLISMATLTQAQDPTCNAQLTNLNVCVPFIVPGTGSSPSTPSPSCCSALQQIDHICICNALRVTAQLPAQCNLPALSCPSP
ncbi:hypothetical protein ACHQM5_011333 [Ranunculus cassubicifolius]